MPELPEVEIVARRIGAAVAGAVVEAAWAPGINTLKTVDPPLEALVGRRIAAGGDRAVRAHGHVADTGQDRSAA